MISLKRSSLHCVSSEPEILSQRYDAHLGSVHFIDGNNELPDTKSEGEQGMLSSLAILRDTGLEFTSTSGNDEDSAISLGGTSDHVLDEVAMSRGVNDLDFLRLR